MSVDRRKAQLFVAAATLRLILFVVFPSLSDLLSNQVELSTPVTSFSRLQEGVFLFTRNISPYDGGVYHQAPFFLPLFSLLPDPQMRPLYTNLLYIAVDLATSWALMSIAESGVSVSSRQFTSSRKHLRWDSSAVGAAFLFNPFTLLTCLARPTSNFTNLATVIAIAKAARGSYATAISTLAFASYLSMHPVLLLPPMTVLSYDQYAVKSKKPYKFYRHVLKCVIVFGLSLLALFWLSFQLTGSWEFLESTYGVRLLLPDLTPNVGLWWYFFVEIFDPFRSFYLGVFWLHLASYVFGLTIRLQNQPLFAVVTLIGLFAVFQPYPSIADANLYLCLLPLYRHLFPLMRYSFIAATAILYSTVLGPAFYYLWIYAGSGNANFFYAITLVWSLGLIVVIADSLYAALREEWEIERPEMVGQDSKQI